MRPSQAPVNIRAAERVGKLHDAIQVSGYHGHGPELLLVRMQFCPFVAYRNREDGSDRGTRLAQRFQVLNKPEDKRSRMLDEQLAACPYVNGKLFEESLAFLIAPYPCYTSLLPTEQPKRKRQMALTA